MSPVPHVPSVRMARLLRFLGAAAIGASVLLLAASFYVSYDNLLKLRAGDRLVDGIRARDAAANVLLLTLKDAESGQRAYLLTGNPAFLEPYEAALARVQGDVAALENAAGADVHARETVSPIHGLVAARMDIMAEVIAVRRRGQMDAALAMFRLRRGKGFMDQIAAHIAAMRQEGEASRARLRSRTRSDAAWQVPIGAAALAALLLAGVAVEQLRQRRIGAAALAAREKYVRAFGLTPSMLRDVDGRITFWGAGMERLYGYAPEQAVGRLKRELLETRFPTKLEDINAELLANGTWRGELTHRRRDGASVTVSSHWVLHRDAVDGALSVVEMVQDISSQLQAETHLQLALDAAGLGTWSWDLGGDGEMKWDAKGAALLGAAPDCTPCYALWASLVLPEDLPAAEAAIARMLDPACPDDDGAWEYRVQHPGGRVAWIAATGRASFAPSPAAPAGSHTVPAGRVAVHVSGTARDISAAKTAMLEQQRITALLRAIIESTPGLIYAKDRQGRMLLANPAVLALIGKPWAEVEGRRDTEFLDNLSHAKTVVANDCRVMEQGEPEIFEELVGTQNGRPRTWLSTKTPMHDADGEMIGLVGVSMEITERKRAEDRQRQLIHELNHRVKNTLATVQAIALETLRGIDEATRSTFDGRLLALASVHDVLTRETWNGAGLDAVMDGALAPFGGAQGGRFKVAGPPLHLQPRAALALAMGLHELATNALRHGALLAEGGCVDIGWRIARQPEPRFHLTWVERGGPIVAPPARRGFGTRLIERSLAQDLAGTVRIRFDPAGVCCHIEAPLAGLAAEMDDAPEEAWPVVGRMAGRG